MKFRPCIDIHNGKVKQIVGSSLRDAGDQAMENFVSEKRAADYAAMFRDDALSGGHVIMLNSRDSEHYGATKAEALAALAAWPGGLQIGGGVRDDNARELIDAGASHVIVTSYVFRGGEISYEALRRLVSEIGRERIVLDLSCMRLEDGGGYRVMTDRWQRAADESVTPAFLREMSEHCAEFLVHAVSSEGKMAGPDLDLIGILAASPVPVTYAGGIGSYEDIEKIEAAGGGRVDYTVGSALDIYGGSLSYKKLASFNTI